MGRTSFWIVCGLVGVVLLQGCASTPWASRTPPKWVNRPPSENSNYKYYVGKSYKAGSQTEGIETARADAKIQAVEENFGVQVKFQTDTHETIDAAQVMERSRMISKSIHLESFVQVEVYQSEIDEDVFNTAVLYRYSREAIKKEQERLKDNPQPADEIKFNPVDTTPPSTRHPPIVHKVLRASYALGFGGGASAPTVTDINNTSINYNFLAELRLTRHLGLNLDYQYGTSTTNYTNGTLNIVNNVIELGMPVYLSNVDRSSFSWLVEPAAHAVYGIYSFNDAAGTTTSSVNKWQLGPALNLGGQFRLSTREGGGFSLRPTVGIFYPLMNDGAQGTYAIQGGLLLQWEFFKE